jgi:hypothetical protein
MAVKSDAGYEAAAGEARRGSTPPKTISKFTAPDDDVMLALLYASCEFVAWIGNIIRLFPGWYITQQKRNSSTKG